MTKQEWLEMWRLSGEEGERAWEEKQRMAERVGVAPMIAPDIQPYRATVTGELIGSRSAHREYLKRHDLVEVGNEKPTPRPLPDVKEGRREAIIETLRRHKVRGFA